LVSHHHIHTDYLDASGLKQLATVCQAVTTEFENVPADALAQLAATLPVSPAASAVAVAQDRAREKAHFVTCGVPVAPYALIDTAEQLAALLVGTANAIVVDNLLPGILKTSRMGYDGEYVGSLVTLSTLLGMLSLSVALGVLLPLVLA
jgi:5-(carboxyamino)imidazole ribonucleotide synthase